MKYRVAIYDLEYQIEAKSTEGAIRAAIALYAKTETYFPHVVGRISA